MPAYRTATRRCAKCDKKDAACNLPDTLPKQAALMADVAVSALLVGTATQRRRPAGFRFQCLKCFFTLPTPYMFFLQIILVTFGGRAFSCYHWKDDTLKISNFH